MLEVANSLQMLQVVDSAWTVMLLWASLLAELLMTSSLLLQRRPLHTVRVELLVLVAVAEGRS